MAFLGGDMSNHRVRLFSTAFKAALKSLMSAKSWSRHAPGLAPEARRQVARPCEKN